MDYKEKYKAAIERAKEELGSGCFNKGSIEYIFPELKESAGEKIRKALIDYFEGWQTRAIDENAAYYKDIAIKDILAWLEKLKDFDKQLDEAYQTANAVVYKKGYDDGYLEGIVNAKKEFEKSKPTVIDIDKMVSKYANTKESTTNGLPVNCQIRAYRKGINDALNLLLDIEKPITIGKRQLTGKAKELYDNLDAESLAETKEKMLAETKPKFKVGNWYQCTKDFFGKGVTFDKDTAYYCAKEGCLQNQYGCHIAIVKELYDYFKLWTIQDVKDGDVLAGKIDGDDYILIFKQIKDGWVETYGHYYDAVDRFCAPSQLFCREYKGTLHPATKEQRDILFKKMHESGYEWDDEKKETKLLISNGGDFEPELSHKEVSKKSEQDKWTEEDEEMFEEYKLGIQDLMKDAYFEKFCNWIFSLKERLQ